MVNSSGKKKKLPNKKSYIQEILTNQNYISDYSDIQSNIENN